MCADNTARKPIVADPLCRDPSHAHFESDVHIQALEASIDGIAILDEQEHFVFINRSFANVFGYNSTEDIQNRNWRTLLPIKELQQFHNKLIPLLSNRGKLRVELTGMKRWGTRFPLELSLAALENGETICIVKEITKRKEAELQAHLMGLFAELNPYPVLRFKASGEIMMANPAAEVIFKLSPAHKGNLGDLIPEFKAFDLNSCIAESKLVSCTSVIGDRHFHFILRGVSDRNFGQLYGTDISELIDAKKELQESQSFLRKVIDTDPNLIFVKDHEGRFVLANQATADLYGTTISDIVGKQDADFNSNKQEIGKFLFDDLDVIENHIEKVIEEEVTDSEGNTHWLETVKKPFVTRNDETLVLGVGHDVTDNKKLHAQLAQSQKMEAIGKLAGGIAHDFNNLLTGVIGYTTLIQNSSCQPEQVNHAAKMIQNAAEKAGALTQKLLGFARQGKHQNTVVDLNNTIKDTIQLLRRTVEENILISEDLCENPLTVMGDPVQLQQVILNLIINARDAIHIKPKRGNSEVIRVKTKVINLDNNARISANKAGTYVEILISDSGCGIASANIDRIFEPFFTTKDTQGGTGMGLAMVYGIVQNHGGTIEAHSTEGKGSTFEILLPYSSNQPVEKVSKPPTAPIYGEGRILLVDDHAVIREVASSILSNLGYTIVTAEDGQVAVEYYELHSKEIDLVILDMIMPRMGASECFDQLKKINSNVRVILSTGYVDNNSVQKIMDQGLCGFIQKPYHVEQLSQVVAEALKNTREYKTQ